MIKQVTGAMVALSMFSFASAQDGASVLASNPFPPGAQAISGQPITKPACPAGQSPVIFLGRAEFELQGAGASATFYREAPTSWTVFVQSHVKDSDPWINHPGVKVYYFTQCHP